ncbi:MAG: hypothetical protein GXP42_05300 [Chloroflexi bacterium]|nr:hypothetical protein [Chloroflexota bacterium]
MSATATYQHPEPILLDAARDLSEIAHRLGEISRALAATAEGEHKNALMESEEALAQLSQEMKALQQEKGAERNRKEETERLRREILAALRRGGPALPIELAAATLSLPEEVNPVLEDMAEEGLIAIGHVLGGHWITLRRTGCVA